MRVRMMLVGILAISGVALAASWQTVAPAGSRFRVSMPGTPETNRAEQRSLVGTVVSETYTVWNGPARFVVDYSQLPDHAVKFAGPDTIFEHAKGGLLKQSLGKPTSFTDITLGSVPGKRLLYDVATQPGRPAMKGEARFYLADNRLYVVDAGVPAGEGEADASRFFSSFTLE